MTVQDLSNLPTHNVLASPWTYEVTSFTWSRELSTQSADALEVTLEKDGEVVRLKFTGVSDFEVERGFPWHGSGLHIIDASSRGMEDARIWVSGVNQDAAMRFWARAVERLRV